jgi:multiple sugar transport system substrate-binding protein
MTPRLSRRAALALPAALAAPAIPRAQGAVGITVHYPQPLAFKDSFDAIAAAFARAEPQISVGFVTSPSYADGAQQVLRQAVTDQLPDLSFQSFNLLRMFAERGIAQDLAPLLTREGDPAAAGYTPPLLALARFAGIQAGLPYAASNAICYLNAELLRRAGFDPDALPADWDGHLALAGTVSQRVPGADGMWFAHSEWTFQTLLYGHGGRMMREDEGDIAFDGPEGLATMRLLARMPSEARMPPLNPNAAVQALAAGRLGIHYRSTAVLASIAQAVGRNFELRTTVWPVMPGRPRRIAIGGAAGMLTARDPARREAAWRFLRFATGAEGQALMAMASGYVPCNQRTIDEPRWLAEFYRQNPLFRPAVEQMSAALPWFAFPGANATRIALSIGRHVEQVLERDADPARVLAEMAADVRRLLRSRG